MRKTALKSIIPKIMFLLFCIVIMQPVSGFSEKTITFAFLDHPDKSPQFRLAKKFYSEAFRRLGIQFEYKVFPQARCGYSADRGIVDGEPGRYIFYNRNFPNLIRVNEAVMTIKVSAFSKIPDLRVNGWDSLNRTPYRVEYIIGTAIAKDNLAGRVPPENLSSVPHVVQSFKKLRADRIDILVQTELLALAILEKPEYKKIGIKKAGVLQHFAIYPFLHKKHKELANDLAETIRQMKNEKLVTGYYKQALKEHSKAIRQSSDKTQTQK